MSQNDEPKVRRKTLDEVLMPEGRQFCWEVYSHLAINVSSVITVNESLERARSQGNLWCRQKQRDALGDRILLEGCWNNSELMNINDHDILMIALTDIGEFQEW